MKLSPNFYSEFTNNTYFFIYFANQNLQELLFYKQSILTYTTIISTNKWYIIDSINLINNYNYYNFSIIEGYKDDQININIRIKKYRTYDIEYIKNNIPVSIDEYDETKSLINNNELIFKTCENHNLEEKIILIYIELSYNSEKSSLYKYSFQKFIDNMILIGIHIMILIILM